VLPLTGAVSVCTVVVLLSGVLEAATLHIQLGTLKKVSDFARIHPRYVSGKVKDWNMQASNWSHSIECGQALADVYVIILLPSLVHVYRNCRLTLTFLEMSSLC